jgi:hypothetical protein
MMPQVTPGPWPVLVGEAAAAQARKSRNLFVYGFLPTILLIIIVGVTLIRMKLVAGSLVMSVGFSFTLILEAGTAILNRIYTSRFRILARQHLGLQKGEGPYLNPTRPDLVQNWINRTTDSSAE